MAGTARDLISEFGNGRQHRGFGRDAREGRHMGGNSELAKELLENFRPSREAKPDGQPIVKSDVSPKL